MVAAAHNMQGEVSSVKVFLFLYPTSRYIDDFVKDAFGTRGLPMNLDRLNQIIDIRYRQQDYKVIWVTEGKKPDYSQPDPELISDLIDIRKEDQVVSCGSDFVGFIHGYDPTPQIFAHLPPTTTNLVVGGYHQWDCVDHMAEFSYYKGILTWVDEDTTERYFSQMGLSFEIPDTRVRTLDGIDMTKERLNLDEYRFRKMVLEPRSEKPWFTHE